MHDILDAPQQIIREQNVVFAPFNRRFGALVIDVILLYAWSWFFEKLGLSNTLSIVLYTIAHIGQSLYGPVLEGAWGATFGKKWVKLLVVNQKFERIGYRQAFLRNIFPLLLFFLVLIKQGLAYLYPELPFYQISDDTRYGLLEIVMLAIITAWYLAEILVYLSSDKKQALHDKIAGTYVVDADSVNITNS